jgi:hypothetical protein
MGTVIRRAIALAALATVMLLPGVAAAAEPTFHAAKATATFLDSIEVEQRVTLPSGVARIEALVRAGTGGRTFLADVANPGPGARTLRYRYQTPSGSLYPNTVVELGFRVTLEDGTTFDGPTDRVRYEDTRFAWRTLEGDLVRIHWVEGDEAFGRRALRIGDEAVRNAAELLGVTETEPIDFFIYSDETAFRTALGPGTRENVGGQAHADIRTLFALITPGAIDDPWVGIVVPHELTHLVFDTAVENPYRFPPRWLNEGLAVYLSEGYGSGDQNRVADAVQTRDLIPLVALGAQFPTDPDKTFLAYAESVSAIDYLVREHGRDAMVALVVAYKDGLTDDEAFTKALGVDLDTFQTGWLEGLGAQPPEQFGPQPAPPGPLPTGWSGEAPNGVPDPITPTSRPGATAVPGDASAEPDAAADTVSIPLLVGGLALVVGVVIGGLVIARRRGGTA